MDRDFRIQWLRKVEYSKILAALKHAWYQIIIVLKYFVRVCTVHIYYDSCFCFVKDPWKRNRSFDVFDQGVPGVCGQVQAESNNSNVVEHVPLLFLT